MPPPGIDKWFTAQQNVKMPRGVRLRSSQQLSICREYASGHSSIQIARKYNITAAGICKVLRRNGIQIRTPSELSRKYRCDERYFRDIDTEPKAYWLGLLAADGYIHGPTNQVKLTLQTMDRQHLQRFAIALSSDLVVHDYNYVSPVSTINIYSALMVADLDRLGIHQCKTATVQMPVLPFHLRKHFIRGYYDGNGCICQHRGNQTWSVVGNRRIIEQIHAVLIEELDVSAVKLYVKPCHRNRSNPPSALRYCGRQAMQILQWLNDGATIALPRKQPCLRVWPFPITSS